MASRTVTSEMAMVPDSEFKEPTLTVGPEVSTHDWAFAESDSVALLPQPASSRPAVATMLPVASADLLNEERRGSRIDSLSLYQQRASEDERRLERRFDDTPGVSNRDVRAAVFLPNVCV
jgi:hypothetical protein